MTLDDKVAKSNDQPVKRFTISNNEDLEKYREFLNHSCPYTRKEKPVTSAIGGALTYHFTPNNLGTTVKVSCACGAEVDLTRYENW